MITHIFNSSVVSGPETLVLPALKKLEEPVSIIFLLESRRWDEAQKPIEYARELGHDVYKVVVGGRWDRAAFAELRAVLDHLKPRIAHAHDVKASVYLRQAQKLKPGLSCRIVSTHHGAASRKGKLKLYEEFYVRWILPHFDYVLSVCEHDRHSIVRRGVHENRVGIHRNGADRPKIDADQRREKAIEIRRCWKQAMPSLPDPEHAVFLGAVARLSPEKRHDRMLNVLSFLPDEVVLLCFGTGAEEKRLRGISRELGVESRVFWMGYSSTISSEMAGFDLLLCLSDGEGIPINLLEAGWAATPVVATQVGGIPDLISSPEEGFLVQKEEDDELIAWKIQKVLYDHVSLKKVGGAFQRRVTSHFSETAWLGRLREVYRSLLGEPRTFESS